MKVEDSGWEKRQEAYEEALASLRIKPSSKHLLVSLDEQKLALVTDAQIAAVFPVSTSKNPPSCRDGSFGTPTGLHAIAEKIGEGHRPGTVFKGRRSLGFPYWDTPEDFDEADPITTRILWLRGLEEGHNAGEGVDSHARYIYLHGTAHEEQIGTPASHGCIRLTNHDILRLYEETTEGTHVFIAP